MRNKGTKIAGLILFIALIAGIIGYYLYTNPISGDDDEIVDVDSLETVYVATGGGKEDFLKDEEVVKIIQKKYGLNVVYDSWSNGKMIVNDLVREDGTRYDAMFCSDERFYNYFKLPADQSKGEAKRDTVIAGSLTLNTPIVFYSWAPVVDVFINEGIVTVQDGTYYITDMDKLISYILEGKKWKDIGLNDIYGTINISSTDPVTSSPGTTFYGLLLSIMSGGEILDENIEQNLPNLREFYLKSGYMNNTPADLFEGYLKTGMGAKPLIVDYEKSLVEFKNSNPKGFESIKDNIRLLYPAPTVWNSHCIAAFNEKGEKFLKVFDDEEISQIAWQKYGFRTGIAGGNFDTSTLGIEGIPSSIRSVVPGLKMSSYERVVEYLKESN
ncbi:MAG: hypothetical protein IKN74_01650 [Clostridia bacterium]|nr:hypothetical protein [Clostridia bacterium]